MSERWKPGYKETYYCIFCDGSINDVRWMGTVFDKTVFELGNCFATKDEAIAAAEKVKDLLLSLHKPTADGSQLVTDCNQLPDWCKVGAWVYHDSDGYYYTVKSIDIENDNIQIRDEESEYTYTANEIKTFFSKALRRQYTAAEMRELVGKVIKETKTGDISFVTGFCNRTERIYSGANSFSAESLLSDFVFTDNAPCGKLEHLENGEWVE